MIVEHLCDNVVISKWLCVASIVVDTLMLMAVVLLI